jgi:hypothetical protein
MDNGYVNGASAAKARMYDQELKISLKVVFWDFPFAPTSHISA